MAGKKKIAVVYDTSFLVGDFQSIKKFIMSRRFSSQEKTGLLKSLPSVIAGRKRPEQTVVHNAQDLLEVVEIIPSEVTHEMNNEFADVEKDKKIIAGLLAGGATKVDLAMDTVVSTMGTDMDTDEKLALFARRLTSYVTVEKFDLAVVATEEDTLVTDLAEGAKNVPVLGIKAEQLTGTRILHDKITEILSYNRPSKIVMEN